MDLLSALMEDEGYRRYAYKCPAGKLTIGYGRNIDPAGGKGLTQAEATHLLVNDIRECEYDLREYFGAIRWDAMGIVRQNALINMRLNLGPTRFRSFKRMIQAISEHDWDRAANEALDSIWARQVGGRATRIASELRSGLCLM